MGRTALARYANICVSVSDRLIRIFLIWNALRRFAVPPDRRKSRHPPGLYISDICELHQLRWARAKQCQFSFSDVVASRRLTQPIYQHNSDHKLTMAFRAQSAPHHFTTAADPRNPRQQQVSAFREENIAPTKHANIGAALSDRLPE